MQVATAASVTGPNGKQIESKQDIIVFVLFLDSETIQRIKEFTSKYKFCRTNVQVRGVIIARDVFSPFGNLNSIMETGFVIMSVSNIDEHRNMIESMRSNREPFSIVIK